MVGTTRNSCRMCENITSRHSTNNRRCESQSNLSLLLTTEPIPPSMGVSFLESLGVEPAQGVGGEEPTSE
jgi:hypothetical protein